MKPASFYTQGRKRQLCVTLCPFYFGNHLDGKERADCFALCVFLVSRDCYVALPHDATGLSAVCNCDIF